MIPIDTVSLFAGGSLSRSLSLTTRTDKMSLDDSEDSSQSQDPASQDVKTAPQTAGQAGLSSGNTSPPVNFFGQLLDLSNPSVGGGQPLSKDLTVTVALDLSTKASDDQSMVLNTSGASMVHSGETLVTSLLQGDSSWHLPSSGTGHQVPVSDTLASAIVGTKDNQDASSVKLNTNCAKHVLGSNLCTNSASDTNVTHSTNAGNSSSNTTKTVPYSVGQVPTCKVQCLNAGSSSTTAPSLSSDLAIQSTAGTSALGNNLPSTSLSADQFVACRDMLSHLQTLLDRTSSSSIIQNPSMSIQSTSGLSDPLKTLDVFNGNNLVSSTTITPSSYLSDLINAGCTKAPSLNRSLSSSGSGMLYNSLTLPLSQGPSLKRSISTPGFWGNMQKSQSSNDSMQSGAPGTTGPQNKRCLDSMRSPSPTAPHSLPPKKQRRCYTCTRCGVNLSGAKSSQCGVGHHTCSHCLEERVKMVLTGKAKVSTVVSGVLGQ